MRAMVLVMLVSACGRLGFAELATRDASAEGGTPADAGSCALTFGTNAMQCASWGAASAQGTTTVVSAGELVITPTTPTTGVTFGGCTSNVELPFTASGFVAHVPQTLTPTTAGVYTVLQGLSGSAKSSPYDLSAQSGMLMFFDNNTQVGAAAYDAVAMQWWRLVPMSTGAAALAQTSPDGQTWTTLATSTTPPPQTLILTVGAGTFEVVTGAAGAASFATVLACP